MILFLVALCLRCCVQALSSCAESGGYSPLQCMDFLLRWLLLWNTESRHTGVSGCSTQAQQLWHTGLVALRHVESTQTTDRTRVPCTGRWIPIHCTTREVPVISFKTLFTSSNFFFFQQIFIDHLPCVWHNFRHRGHNGEWNRQKSQSSWISHSKQYHLIIIRHCFVDFLAFCC